MGRHIGTWYKEKEFFSLKIFSFSTFEYWMVIIHVILVMEKPRKE